MNDDELYDVLSRVCQYAHICPSSNYGSLDVCVSEKMACGLYESMRLAEVSLLKEFGFLEMKVLVKGDEVEEDEHS